jgi:serine/threonine protein kinase
MKSEEPSLKSNISEDMKTLIMQCLQREPKDRPTIEEILKHPALKELPVQ